jgi:1-acyl-sn-glycerol-3-phosphate acyltransferase
MDDWKFEKARDLHLSTQERHRSTFRESGVIETTMRLIWWSGVRLSFKLYHRIEFHGQENLPASPSFVIAANHGSHLDALVIGAGLPLRLRDQMFPLAAGDLFFQVPAMAAFSAMALNALPVWRKNCGKQGLQDLRQRLVTDKCVYILFPEGTRSRSGEMASFRSGLGMMMAGTSVPVIPCLIRGTFASFPPNSYFPRPHKISVTFGTALEFSGTENKRSGWDEIARKTESAVSQLRSAKESSSGIDPPSNHNPNA